MPIIGTKKLIKLEVLNWTDAALFLFSLEVTNSAGVQILYYCPVFLSTEPLAIKHRNFS